MMFVEPLLFGASIDFVAVIAAAAVSFVIGVVWYAPPLLGKYWIEESKQGNTARAGIGRTLGSAVISSLLIAFALEVVLVGLNLSTWTSVIGLAALAWLGFYFTKDLASMVSGDRPMKVFVSITIHDATMLFLMTAVLFALR